MKFVIRVVYNNRSHVYDFRLEEETEFGKMTPVSGWTEGNRSVESTKTKTIAIERFKDYTDETPTFMVSA